MATSIKICTRDPNEAKRGSDFKGKIKLFYKSKRIRAIPWQSHWKTNMNISFGILIALCAVFRVNSEELLEPKGIEGWPKCEPGGTYNLPHSTYCDHFFICSNGNIYLSKCDDGLAYIPYKGCTLMHYVDCSTRPNLQNPKGSGNCPRLNGIYKDYNKCGQFFSCTNGTAVVQNCDPAYVFDDFKKICRYPTEEENRECYPIDDLFVPPPLNPPITVPVTEAPVAPAPIYPAESTPPGIATYSGIGSSTPEEAAQFRCPSNGLYPFGDHARYPYPGNCHFFFMCFKDGTMKISGCQMGSGYSAFTLNCDMSIRC